MLASLAFFGCDEETVKMRLLAYDNTSETYELKDVSLTTLTDVDRLAGDATVIRGGLSLVLDYQEGELDWKRLGHPVVFSGFNQDGVLIPENYDSLAMASVYYSMEQSYLFFRDDLGLDDTLLKRLPTYYRPEVMVVTADGERLMEQDNAFYMKVENDEQAFFIIHHKLFQWIPMSLNGGIITHEYTHYVFDTLVLEKSGELDADSRNFLLSVNEGIADFMAVARTRDPRFMSHSIPLGLLPVPCNSSFKMDISRDIANPQKRNYTRSMDTWARATSPSNYCPYEIGLFWAGVLYETAQSIDSDDSGEPSPESLRTVSRWLIAALGDLGAFLSTHTSFELHDMMTLFVDQIVESDHRATFCDILAERYDFGFSEVEGC